MDIKKNILYYTAPFYTLCLFDTSTFCIDKLKWSPTRLCTGPIASFHSYNFRKPLDVDSWLEHETF